MAETRALSPVYQLLPWSRDSNQRRRVLSLVGLSNSLKMHHIQKSRMYHSQSCIPLLQIISSILTSRLCWLLMMKSKTICSALRLNQDDAPCPNTSKLHS